MPGIPRSLLGVVAALVSSAGGKKSTDFADRHRCLRQTANRTKEPSNFAVPSPLYRQGQIGVHRCNLDNNQPATDFTEAREESKVF